MKCKFIRATVAVTALTLRPLLTCVLAAFT